MQLVCAEGLHFSAFHCDCVRGNQPFGHAIDIHILACIVSVVHLSEFCFFGFYSCFIGFQLFLMKMTYLHNLI